MAAVTLPSGLGYHSAPCLAQRRLRKRSTTCSIQRHGVNDTCAKVAAVNIKPSQRRAVLVRISGPGEIPSTQLPIHSISLIQSTKTYSYSHPLPFFLCLLALPLITLGASYPSSPPQFHSLINPLPGIPLAVWLTHLIMCTDWGSESGEGEADGSSPEGLAKKKKGIKREEEPEQYGFPATLTLKPQNRYPLDFTLSSAWT